MTLESAFAFIIITFVSCMVGFVIGVFSIGFAVVWKKYLERIDHD